MRIVEERLSQVRAGRWSAAALTRHNPVILAAVDELLEGDASAGVGRRAAGLFATALGLDLATGPRVSVTVAARAVHEVATMRGSEVERCLRDLVTDPLVVLVVAGVAGEEAPFAVRRALCLVARMVTTQAEVAALRQLMDDGDRPAGEETAS